MNNCRFFFGLISVFFAASISQAAGKSCYQEEARNSSGSDKYTVTFKSETTLEQNASGNYSKRFSYERNFGCILFSKVKNLSGTYKSTQGSYLRSTCKDKSDYAFMQFATQDGKEVFRIQCEKAAYEDQDSEKFVPSAEDVESLLSQLVTVEVQ